MSTLTPPPRPVTPLGLLAARLDGLAELARASDADPALQAGLFEACELAVGLDPYLERWSTPESPELRAVAERTRTHDWTADPDPAAFLEQEMLSGHLEGQFLKMLVHATGARRVLEIGMFTGYAALAMAEALPPGGRVVACEIDPATAAIAREGFAGSAAGSRIEVRTGPAARTLAELADEGQVFDLVFLDADKAGYCEYLMTLVDRDLIGAQSLVCVDNTLMQGEPWTTPASSPNGAAIHEFNRVVAQDARLEQVIVPLRDGITLIRLARP